MSESAGHGGTARGGSGSGGDKAQRRAAREKARNREDKDRTAIRRQIQDLLREEDSRSFTGSLGTFLSGLGTCLVGGLVFATVLTLGLNSVTREGKEPFLHWRGWFGIYLVALGVLVVVALLREGDDRSRGKQTVESFGLGDSEPADDAPADGAAAVAAPVPGAVSNAWQTLVRWGPRSLMEGIAGLRGKWTARQNLKFKRAAQIVVTLAKYDGAVAIPYLVRPPEDMRIFASAVEWLERNMWIGRSSDHERLYLSTPGKEKLRARSLTPNQKARVIREG